MRPPSLPVATDTPAWAPGSSPGLAEGAKPVTQGLACQAQETELGLGTGYTQRTLTTTLPPRCGTTCWVLVTLLLILTCVAISIRPLWVGGQFWPLSGFIFHPA